MPLSGFLDMASDSGQDEGSDLRIPCSTCGRKFVSDALERHIKICEKTSQKKRKAFDSAKQRFQGTDIPTVSSAPAQLTSLPPTHKTKSPKKTLSTKGSSPGSLSIRNRLNADFVQCPTCERNFNEKAAERHIAWCKEQNARIPRSPPCTDAKERLAARTQYRAPFPGKLRRTSPPRNIALSKAWAQSSSSNHCYPTSPVSPNGPHTVKVTGTAITAHQRNGDSKHSSQPSTPITQGDLGKAFGGSNGMIHSTSWEWVSPKNFTPRETGPNISNNASSNRMLPKSYNEEDADIYDPYISAQRQMEELMMGTSRNSTITPKPSISNNRASTNQIRENKLRTNQLSSWSLESDDNMEEIEEKIEDLMLDNDPKYEEIVSHLNKGGKPNRLHRRAVSREEALFGTKNSSGSQDSDYGSLLVRRSPSSPARLSPSQHFKHHSDDIIEHNLLTSTSSSETSLPPLDLNGTGNNDILVKLPRFCHECGTKYPIANAKFCCECGARRLCAA